MKEVRRVGESRNPRTLLSSALPRGSHGGLEPAPTPHATTRLLYEHDRAGLDARLRAHRDARCVERICSRPTGLADCVRPPPSHPLVLSPLRAAANAGFYKWPDLVYRPGSADTKHRLDLYIPNAPFPRPLLPVFVFVHGGAWVRGDKNHPLFGHMYGNVGIACARSGVVGAVVNYRMAPAVSWTEQLDDVRHAVRWVHANARRFGGDPQRLVLGGHSAGGHLSVLAALKDGSESLDSLIDAGRAKLGDSTPPAPVSSTSTSSSTSIAHLLRGVVGLSGVYDLPSLGRLPVGPTILEPAFSTDPRVWKAAAPLDRLRTGRSRWPAHLPLLVGVAEEDFHLDEDAAHLAACIHGTTATSTVADAAATPATLPPSSSTASSSPASPTSSSPSSSSSSSPSLSSSPSSSSLSPSASTTTPKPPTVPPGFVADAVHGPVIARRDHVDETGARPRVVEVRVAGRNHVTLSAALGTEGDALSSFLTDFVRNPSER